MVDPGWDLAEEEVNMNGLERQTQFRNVLFLPVEMSGLGSDAVASFLRPGGGP